MASKTFDVKAFENWSNRSMSEMSSMAERIVEDAIVDGADVMRNNIMTRGTDKQWGGFWPSRAQGRKDHSTSARFDTGEMRDSVESEMLIRSRARVVGQFGWLKNQQEYFQYQEKGFNHRNGQVIPAMNALRDAFTYATNKVESELRKAFK